MIGAPKPAMFHMLKSLGINPEVIENTANDLKDTANKVSLAFALMDEKMNRIEAKLNLLLEAKEGPEWQKKLSLPSPKVS